MKKTLKIVLVILLLLSNKIIISKNTTDPNTLSGDFGIYDTPGFNTSVIIEIVSVPFEGITSARSNQQYNRFGQIQNGDYWRFYCPSCIPPVIYRNIGFITGYSNNPSTLNTFIDIGHCSAVEFPNSNIPLTWGFAKYKITITVAPSSQPESTKVFKLYLNSLDSKFQDIDHGGYGADLFLQFDPIENRVEFSKALNSKDNAHIDYIYTTDILPNGEPTKEYKVWEVVPTTPRNPVKDFYAKTTPFPINPRAIDFEHKRVLELGTDVNLDGVYGYTGENDKYGYNTIDSGPPLYYNWHNYYSNPPIPIFDPENDKGRTYVTPATYYTDGDFFHGFRLNVLIDNTITIANDKRLWISGYPWPGEDNKGDTVFFHEGSKLVMESYAQLNSCRGGKIIDSSALITWTPYAFMHIYEFSEIAFWLNNNIINNCGHIEVDANGVFKVCDNSTVTFSGAGTYLKLNPNSIVKLGENAKIEFKDGAYLIADGIANNKIQFSSIDASKPGTGLILENAGSQTSITNCNFTNLKTALRITNDNLAYAGIYRNISNNSFNMNGACQYGMYFTNTFNTNIQYNTINMTGNAGCGILLRYTIETQEEGDAIPVTVNILNNNTYYGAISAAFICTTSELVSPNVLNNYFNNATGIGIVGTHIAGNFNYNTVALNTGSTSFQFTQSHPNLYSNTVNSNYINIFSNDSYEYMAPVQSGGDLILIGGKNKFTSFSDGNLYFINGKAYLDYGENCFTKSSNPLFMHLWGEVNESTPYNMRNNDFNGSNDPDADQLFEYGTLIPVYPYTSGSTFDCSASTDGGSIWLIRDLGNGIFDTIYSKPNTTGTQPTQDEALYQTGILKKTIKEYYNAITVFKMLINNYPASGYSDASLFSLYECYEGLDTSSIEGIRIALYGDLISYLNSKISSGQYSDEFNSNAYQIITMSEAKIYNLNSAMEGYEFIALYHPDPYIRLLASWDFAELEALINGGGAVSSKEEKMTDEEFKDYLIKKVRKSIKGDPIKNLIKKSYDKISDKNTKKKEKDILSKTTNQNIAKQELSRLKKEDEKIISKCISVLRTSKSLTKDERDKRQIEDILFTQIDKNKKSDNLKESTLPLEYGLSQNYPNPFNPITNIKYQLPKDGLVTLKVYDITGREIAKLVNEVKQAGNYIISFDGSNFASGVYFYRIQSGDFMQVKKMVLLK